MLKEKNFRAVDVILPFVTLNTEGGSGYEAQCELTLKNIQYNDIISKVFVARIDTQWPHGELSTVLFEIYELRRAAQMILGSHFPSGLFTFQFHHVDHLVDSSERAKSIFVLNAGLP